MLISALTLQYRAMSFILVGFGKKTLKDLGETGREQKCVWCSNTIIYHLILIRTWFTCYFVRVFSYRSEYLIRCPVCAQSVEIYDDEINAAKKGELRIRSYTANSCDEQE